MREIANQLNITIIQYPFPNDISGVFFKKDGKLFIGVNESDSEYRQRFTIAHEIGHCILHPTELLHYDRQEIVHFRAKNLATPAEVEANYFAAELLMPEERILICVNNGIRSISELANRFKVSEEAMEYRLINLGLL